MTGAARLTLTSCPLRIRYIFYTGLGNLCDLSAAVFPVTKVDPAVDVQALPHAFHSELDERIYNLCKLALLAEQELMASLC